VLTKPNQRIALLIDGDNAQPSLIEAIFKEVGKYGEIAIKRIYGDWTSSNMSNWKKVLQQWSIQPIQQFRLTASKNSTDCALVIDAMDILYMEKINGFCIVSNDSDYTRLATRSREKGLFVIGVGKPNTPSVFMNACHLFLTTEQILPSLESTPDPEKKPPPLLKTPKPNLPHKLESQITENIQKLQTIDPILPLAPSPCPPKENPSPLPKTPTSNWHHDDLEPLINEVVQTLQQMALTGNRPKNVTTLTNHIKMLAHSHSISEQTILQIITLLKQQKILNIADNQINYPSFPLPPTPAANPHHDLDSLVNEVAQKLQKMLVKGRPKNLTTLTNHIRALTRSHSTSEQTILQIITLLKQRKILNITDNKINYLS